MGSYHCRVVEEMMKIEVVVNGRVRVQECLFVNSCGVR